MSFAVALRFQSVDLKIRLSAEDRGSQQPGVPIALKACNSRRLEGGNDERAGD
jgi:hypothetical protein